MRHASKLDDFVIGSSVSVRDLCETTGMLWPCLCLFSVGDQAAASWAALYPKRIGTNHRGSNLDPLWRALCWQSAKSRDDCVRLQSRRYIRLDFPGGTFRSRHLFFDAVPVLILLPCFQGRAPSSARLPTTSRSILLRRRPVNAPALGLSARLRVAQILPDPRPRRPPGCLRLCPQRPCAGMLQDATARSKARLSSERATRRPRAACARGLPGLGPVPPELTQ